MPTLAFLLAALQARADDDAETLAEVQSLAGHPDHAAAMLEHVGEGGGEDVVEKSYRKSAQHAPHNMSVQGKEYRGGEFIPGDVMERATPEEKAKVEGGGGAKLPDEKGGPTLLSDADKESITADMDWIDDPDELEQQYFAVDAELHKAWDDDEDEENEDAHAAKIAFAESEYNRLRAELVSDDETVEELSDELDAADFDSGHLSTVMAEELPHTEPSLVQVWDADEDEDGNAANYAAQLTAQIDADTARLRKGADDIAAKLKAAGVGDVSDVVTAYHEAKDVAAEAGEAYAAAAEAAYRAAYQADKAKDAASAAMGRVGRDFGPKPARPRLKPAQGREAFSSDAQHERYQQHRAGQEEELGRRLAEYESQSAAHAKGKADARASIRATYAESRRRAEAARDAYDDAKTAYADALNEGADLIRGSVTTAIAGHTAED